MDASWDGEVLHTILGSLVTVTLTSDLVSKNCIESDADLLYSLRKEFQIWCVDASLDGGLSCSIYWSL